jgi:hypothetical protein
MATMTREMELTGMPALAAKHVGVPLHLAYIYGRWMLNPRLVSFSDESTCHIKKKSHDETPMAVSYYRNITVEYDTPEGAVVTWAVTSEGAACLVQTVL